MKSIFLFISIMVVTTLTTHAQTQEEIDEALKYYPLEVGNYWEYQLVTNSEFKKNIDANYFSIEVVSDTTLGNGQVYKKLKSINFPGWLIVHYEFDIETTTQGLRVAHYLERNCNTTANVYQWKPTSNDEYNEVLIDSLMTEQYNFISASRWPYITDGVQRWPDFQSQMELFGETVILMYYEALSLGTLRYGLAKDYGLAHIVSGSYLIELSYFRDHEGNEFGEAFDVSTPTQTEIPQRATLLSFQSVNHNSV